MKKLLVVIAAVIGFCCFMSCQPPSWLVGHDNGEAYERYMESVEREKTMKKLEEMGLAPDIYGYGW